MRIGEKAADRIGSEEQLNSILDKILSYRTGGGVFDFRVSSSWQGYTRWARNRIGMASNKSDYSLFISQGEEKGYGRFCVLNQIDDESLKNAVAYVEWLSKKENRNIFPQEFPINVPPVNDRNANVWSDHTVGYNFFDSGKMVQLTCGWAEDAGLMTAGYIDCTAFSSAYVRSNATTGKIDRGFTRLTRGQCSITARDPKGHGSGWAGKSDVDFQNIDEETIARRAFDKCKASLNPVRLEPGRYTAILEPQAVAGLVSELLFAHQQTMDRVEAELGKTPFSLQTDMASGLGLTKLGLRVFDERISVWHDPSDPDLGVAGYVDRFHGIGPVTWVKDGVLTELAHDEVYSVNRLSTENNNRMHRKSFRMSGGTTSVDKMIASTKRGIVVTRFSDAAVTHFGSMSASGMTRDGLWLVEDGKITRALRNFRTVESPFFILNSIEELGEPQKVFVNYAAQEEPWLPLGMAIHNFAPQYIVPSLKIRDFSFASTVDAI